MAGFQVITEGKYHSHLGESIAVSKSSVVWDTVALMTVLDFTRIGSWPDQTIFPIPSCPISPATGHPSIHVTGSKLAGRPSHSFNPWCVMKTHLPVWVCRIEIGRAHV